MDLREAYLTPRTWPTSAGRETSPKESFNFGRLNFGRLNRKGSRVPEAGGTATQAGIFYQNSVAALALADLLDLDQRIARERVVEVRLEAPEDVDDIVIRFADQHRKFQSVKLRINGRDRAWARIWVNLDNQRQSPTFSVNDEFVLVVEKTSRDSGNVAELCDRAAASIDVQELLQRLTDRQTVLFDSITSVLQSDTAAFELLRRTSLLHLPPAEIDRELARRRLAGGQSPAPTLLPILRDIAGGEALRRGLFQQAPLRRRLKLEYDLSLGEPAEWGLESYRRTVQRLARIEVPGMGISRPAEELFVWPRVREHDRARPTNFEDEDPSYLDRREEVGLDLRAFPSDRLDRVVVVAGPGYGKSALLTTLSGKLAEGAMVPVLIPLASMASTTDSVISYLTNYVNRDLDLSADWQRLAEEGLLVLLLDGLDEASLGARPLLMQRIAQFSARYPRASWILTVRDAAVFAGLDEATVVELLPLDDSDIERFASTMKSYLGEVDGWEFVRKLKHYPDLDRLARIPLFLMMLLANSGLAMQDVLTRSDLIEAYLKTLFSPAQHKPMCNPVDRWEALRAIAERLAFERLERQEIGATEGEVREVVSRVAALPEETDILIEQLKTNGILKPQSAIRLQFPYPIVQEYLAARHLVDHHLNSLERRIGDAVQRPWAQVIQFALELHPTPGPIIEAMLAREDDAFRTGLRLVGRCIANGATVSPELRKQVGDCLVEYWIHAPSESRERVGRLLHDAFSYPPSNALIEALYHNWLINYGGGDIISNISDLDLTLRILDKLIDRDLSGLMIYHSLRPAFRAAGDAAFRTIMEKMNSEPIQEDEIIAISSLFLNFSAGDVCRELALSAARDPHLPAQARMRAFALAGTPLEEDGIALSMKAFRHEDWHRHYAAEDLVKVHSEPARFLQELFLDSSIPLERRRGLAANVAILVPDAEIRTALYRNCISNSSVDTEIKIALRLIAARFGDRAVFEGLVEEIGQIPVEHAATTIALLGHFPHRALSDRAVEIIRERELSPNEVVRIANLMPTGLLYIFDMDAGFGGALHPAPPHPGLDAWTQLVEGWVDRQDLPPGARLSVARVGAQLGSNWSRAKLEEWVSCIDDMDAPEWTEGDTQGHALGHALQEVRFRKPRLCCPMIEKIVASERYNVARCGISALQATGNDEALRRLIDLHEAKSDWFLRDTIANAIELVAARRGAVVRRVGHGYRMAR